MGENLNGKVQLRVPVLRALWKCLPYKVKCRKGGRVPVTLCPQCGKKDRGPVKAERSLALVNSQGQLQTFLFQGSAFHKAQGLPAPLLPKRNKSLGLLQAPSGSVTSHFSSLAPVDSFPLVILGF